jgi:hypothetical protein
MPVGVRARNMDDDLVQAAMTSTECCTGLRGEILKANDDPGARTVRRHVRSIVDYVFVEKLLRGGPEYSVPEEEMGELVALTLCGQYSSESSSNSD